MLSKSVTIKKALAAVAVFGSAALVLAGCATNEGGSSNTNSNLSGTLSGEGASSQGSAQTAWIAQFQTDNPNVTINYNPDGSGAGRKSFIAGGAAFAGSDAALSSDELKSTFVGCATGSSAIDLPVYISPIAIVFNVAGVTSLNLTPATLANIFNGTITKWNDPAIVSSNLGVTLPNLAITAVHRSDDSGTTQNFTDYLVQASAGAWSQKAAQTFPAAFGGEGAKGTSGVISTVTSGTGTIGYADFSQVGSLSVASIQVGNTFVAPTAAGAAKVVANSPLATGRADNDLAFNLNRVTTDSSEYPLVLVSYVIACQTYKDSATGTLVKAYLNYITSAAGQSDAASAAGSAPLSDDLSAKVAAAIATIQ